MSPTSQGEALGASSEARSSGSRGAPPNAAPHAESFLPLPNKYLDGERSLFSLKDSPLRALLALAWLDFGFEGGENPTPCLSGRYYSRKAIEEAAGLSTTTARRALGVLLEEGLVEERDRGGRGMEYRPLLTVTTEEFTKVPTSLLRALPTLQRNETTLLLCICRQTLGFDRQRYVLGERRLRDLTGLSRMTIRKRLRALDGRGLLFRRAADSEYGGYAYGLDLEALRAAAAASGNGGRRKAKRAETGPPHRAETGPPPRQKRTDSGPMKDYFKDSYLKKRMIKVEKERSSKPNGQRLPNSSHSCTGSSRSGHEQPSKRKAILMHHSFALEVKDELFPQVAMFDTAPGSDSLFDAMCRPKGGGPPWYLLDPEKSPRRWKRVSEWLKKPRNYRKGKVVFGGRERCPVSLGKPIPSDLGIPLREALRQRR